jgi:putative chitinase
VITSGYRRPELNQLVGGVPDSAHVEGCAVDFIVPGKDIKTVYDIIRKMRTDNILPRYDQLIYEHGSWIHLGISSDRPRAQNLRAFTNGGKVVYAPYVPGFEK